MNGETSTPNPSATIEAAAKRPKWVVPLWIMATLGSIVFFRLARGALIPFTLSLLFALVLSGGVEFMYRHRVPRAVSAVLLLIVSAAATWGLVAIVRSPAQDWLANAPHTLRTIEKRLASTEAIVQRFQDTAKRASALASNPPSAPAAGTAAPVAPVTAAAVISETGSLLRVAATILVFTLFLLTAGPPTLARLAAVLGRDLHAAHALKVIEAVRLEVGRYYATLALINVGLGTATALSMQLLGMPTPILWGALAGVLNFIPYLGSAATLLTLTVVAIVTFTDPTHVLLVSATYIALAAIEGQVVQPIFVGRRLELNPVLVFVAVWMGGELWDVAGVVLAVPILVAIKVAASHSGRGAVIVEFLSPSAAGPLLPFRRTGRRVGDAKVRRGKPG